MAGTASSPTTVPPGHSRLAVWITATDACVRPGSSLVGRPMYGLDAVDDRETLRVLLAGLPAREQPVIRMRFYADTTQAQIAAEIGLFQMHVSRLLARTLTYPRGGILTEDDDAAVVTVTLPAGGIRRSPSATQRPAGRAADRSPASASTSPARVFAPGG